MKNGFLMKYVPPLSQNQVAEIDAEITNLINDATANANSNINKRAEELLAKAETETQ